MPPARQYWAVYRFDRHGIPDPESVALLHNSFRQLAAQARYRHLPLTGLQLDIDRSPAAATNTVPACVLLFRIPLAWQRICQHPLQTEHRFFAGPVLYLHKSKLHVRLLSLYERFPGRSGCTDFNRQRHRIEIERSRLGPSRFITQRSRAGLRINAAHQFEARQSNGASVPVMPPCYSSIAEFELMIFNRLSLLLLAPLLSAQTLAPLQVGGQYAAPFEAWLTRQAEQLWDQRDQAIERLSTAAQIRERQASVRQAMLEAIGGLPTTKTPLNARVTGSFTRPGYRVENVVFESQPGFLVTANLYLPTTGQPPYPAILGVAGHSVNGKASATYQSAFAGFARQGFAVLAYDPPGQGERLEYFDLATGRSRPGVGVAEHNMAGLQTLLTGQTLARYFIWDGIRAVDYLLTRPEIDPRRLAVAGNSGGGTQASYLAVFEPRLAAAVASCYITRWRELWSGPGPQDAEQIFPGFLSKGLDFGDFALAHAPRPFLMTTAIRDYFPIAGGRATFKQNQRLFDMLGDGQKAGYFEYDDTHGWSQPRREAATRFLAKNLQQRDTDGRESPFLPEEESILYATPSGLADSAGGRETVHSINLIEARRLAAARPPVTLASLKTALGWKALPALPPARKVSEETRDGIRIEKLELTVEGNVPIPALLFHPPTVRRTILFASSSGKADPDLFELVRAGALVLAVDPRATGESYQAPARSGYRQDYQLAARAMLLGRNLVEMQTADLIAAGLYLQSRPEAANRAPALYAKGALGPAAQFAAALHPGFAELVLERSIVSYFHLAAAQIHEGLNTVVLPGVLRHADLPDVVKLLAPRRVTVVSPVFPNGRRLLKSEVELPGAQVLLRGEGWNLERTLPSWFVQ